MAASGLWGIHEWLLALIKQEGVAWVVYQKEAKSVYQKEATSVYPINLV